MTTSGPGPRRQPLSPGAQGGATPPPDGWSAPVRDGLPALADGGGRPPLGDRPPSAPAPWRGMFDDTTTAGRGCDIVHVFCRTDDPAWARQAVGEIVAQARLPLLTVEPWTWPTDAEIAAMAGAIRACGSRPVP